MKQDGLKAVLNSANLVDQLSGCRWEATTWSLVLYREDVACRIRHDGLRLLLVCAHKFTTVRLRCGPYTREPKAVLDSFIA